MAAEVSETESETSLQHAAADGDEGEQVPSVALEQLATHIPDMLLFRSHHAPVPQISHCFGVIMFVDVSGFTALCESYCSEARSKHDGTDQLTSTLNQYLSHIVQAILDAEGDIVKFAGDAILAFWQCSQFSAPDIVQNTMQESLMMQNNFDNYTTQDGVVLRMKIGLSVGKTDVHYIGVKEFKTFDISGESVDDANLAQSLTRPGTVVLSNKAWEMCNKQNCSFTVVGKGCVMVSEMQTMIDEEQVLSEMMTSGSRRSTIGTVLQSVVNYGVPQSSPTVKTKEQHLGITDNRLSIDSTGLFSEGLSSRTGVGDHIKTLDSEAHECLKSYVLRVVVHKIDHGQDVSWLSEMREVSVLFINLDPGKKTDPYEKQSLLQQSFEVVYPVLTKFGGLMNKVFMFDKGCTFLCVFGLPHAKHEDDAARALKAAREIFNNLTPLQLGTFSIGVTTGVAFCGVVGHPQRHEYTVIGQKVNMAARLMIACPNSVVCDETTRSKSGLAQNQFAEEQPMTLKGIINPESIYSLITESHHIMDVHHSDVHHHTDADNIIGREKEISLFMEELKHVSEHTHRDPGVIMILGSGGIGKTKLLRAMKARAAAMDFRVVSGVGGLVEQNTPFFTVKTLITRLLELDTCKNIHDREQLILEHILDEDTRELLPLLNDLLVLKFPQTQTTLHMHHEERTEVLHKLLYRIIHEEALSKPCVFGIDDAHLVDIDSWNFIQDIAADPNAVLVMTTRPLRKGDKQSSAMLEILNHPHTKVLELKGLPPDDMVTLACNFIDVDTLPDLLQQIIRERSQGIPQWCEELVETMVELEYLLIVETGGNGEGESVEKKKRTVVLRSRKSGSTYQMSNRDQITDIPIPDSVTGIVLTRIDHMSATEQMTLKCAAILGISFTRTMLKAIIPKYSPSSFHKALNTLAQAGIIECATAAEARSMQPDMQTRSKDHLPLDKPEHHCPCLEIEEEEHSHHHDHTTLHAKEHPTVDSCEMLQFVHAYVQEAAYGLWTERQRTSLHESSALFLESEAHKCTNCGGGGFLTGQKKSNPLANGEPPPSNAQRSSLSAEQKLRNSASARRRTSLTTDALGGDALDSDQPRPTSSSPLPPISEGTGPAQGQSLASGVRYNSTGEVDIFGIDLQDCHCDEVLANVYPQLVHHWRAAKEILKTKEYLIESASAAVATFNNMEALSFLYEAQELVHEHKGMTQSEDEVIKMETIIGQALLQSGEAEDSVPHFKHALRLLGTNVPSGKLGVLIQLTSQAFRQWLHLQYPQRYIGRQREGNLLEHANCMELLIHAYKLEGSDVNSLTLALSQLNTVEEAEEDIHELVKAYATIIECCQALHFLSLSNYYTDKAMSRCSDVQLSLDDLSTYVDLLNVGLNTKLCLGRVNEALELGVAARQIASQMHGVTMEMITLPMLLHVQLSCLKIDDCRKTLKEISELASEADDLRSQAVYDCCYFDVLLETGIGQNEVMRLAESAKLACKEDIYHFDEIERFFLVSCLALWYARKGQTDLASHYVAIATGLKLDKFSSYLSLRGLVRFTECCLLLRTLTNGGREHKTQAKKAMKTLSQESKRYPVLKSRRLHLKAYQHFTNGYFRRARRCLSRAIVTAKVSNLKFEEEWATRNRNKWLGTPSDDIITTEECDDVEFFVLI